MSSGNKLKNTGAPRQRRRRKAGNTDEQTRSYQTEIMHETGGGR